MLDGPWARMWRAGGLLRACTLCALCALLSPRTAAAEIAVQLSELDLSAMIAEGGAAGELHDVRTDGGMILRPGASFWVDLKSKARSFTATVAPLPGSKGHPVRCRIATTNEVVLLDVGPNDAPREISIPLAGQTLLVVESETTGSRESGVSLLLGPSVIVADGAMPEAWGGAGPLTWKTPEWSVRLDGRSGGFSSITHPEDRFHMNWLRPAAPWGVGWAELGGRLHEWNRPTVFRATGDQAMEAVYELPGLRLQVKRRIDERQRIVETYTFRNIGSELLVFGEGGLALQVPLIDAYAGATVAQTLRCHAHVWTGGASAYINALRMGGSRPHLGLVLTEGTLAAYSIQNRVQHSNDRGTIVLHPGAMTLAPGEAHSVEWVLFWHEGWKDFFQKAIDTGRFVQLQAERYTVAEGEPLNLVARAGFPLEGARLTINGTPLPHVLDGGVLRAEVVPAEPGEQRVELVHAGGSSLLNAFVAPPPMTLIENRVRFIVERQQRRAPGDPLDGAYLVYDNEKDEQVYDDGFADHNAGRERIAMGVLVALFLPHCADPALRQRLEESVLLYDRFIARELQNKAGVVFNDVGRSGKMRLYNYPWVIQFHLSMYRASGDPGSLRRALETTRAYYANGGDRFYAIGIPVRELLTTLRRAGWHNEAIEARSLFQKHAGRLLQRGSHYPEHEVLYEQSIVGPAAQFLLEMYLSTREQEYLSGALLHLHLLEMFNGLQPDYRLHEIPIRHWDGYWFGGRRTYGDTFPHYWSTITGRVFDLVARATGDVEYGRRARANIENNFCLFRPDGRASAAYLYPLMLNERPGRYFDPWANDQDWALVNWLLSFGPSLPVPKASE